jgi:hypothetical protein
MLRKQQLIQAIGELVIPLLGFFWLGWDLYFILLFYLLDLIATEVFYQLKLARIHQFQQSKSSFFARFSSIGLVGVIIVLSHAMLHKVYPDMVFQDAFIDFLAYEEDGIPIAQGYLLLPLIIFPFSRPRRNHPHHRSTLFHGNPRANYSLPLRSRQTLVRPKTLFDLDESLKGAQLSTL